MKRMTEKKLNNFELYEIDGTLYSLEELKGFIESNEFLQKENLRLLREHRDLSDTTNFQKRQINALKFRCSNYSQKVMELESEIADMKFTRKYLTAEDAGKAFTRELLGKPMTEQDLAIEAAENAYVPYKGDDF